MNEKKQFWTIWLIVFMGFLGISMPYLIFPTLFLNPAYAISTVSNISPALLLGITLAAYPLGQFIGSPILGSLSDDYGRKSLLTGSLLLNGFFNLVTAFSLKWASIELLILSRFASGLMEGNIAIARAMASDMKSLSKPKAFGRISAAASIAYLLGPFIGGFLIDHDFDERLTVATPFYCISLLFLVLSILSIYVLSDSTTILSGFIRKKTLWERFNIFKRLSILFKNKRLKFLMISSTVFTLAVDIFYEFGPVYLTAKWKFGPIDLIIYNALLCITLAISNGWLSGFLPSYYSRRKIISGSIGSLGIFLVGIVLTDSSKIMLTLFAVCGIAIGLAGTLFTVKLSDSAEDTIQGEVMGVQLSLRVLGDAIICILGGVFLMFSSKIVLVMAALMTGILTFYYARNAPLKLGV